jgi:hypothetical protein
MKSPWLLSLPLLAEGAAVQHELFKRQMFDIFGLSVADNIVRKPVLIRKLQPNVRDDAIREEIVWGPFMLQPANGTHKPGGFSLKQDVNSDLISSPVTGLCSNCMVFNAKVDPAFADGKIMDVSHGVYTHHVILSDIGHQLVLPPTIAMCANGGIGGWNFGGTAKTLPSGGAHTRIPEPPPDVNPKPSTMSPPPPVITILSPAAKEISDNLLSSLGIPGLTATGAVDGLLSLAGLPSITTSLSSLETSLSAIPGWSTASKETQAQIFGGLAGGLVGAGIFSIIGAVLGAGLGAIVSGSGGVSTLASELTLRFGH